MQFTLEYALRLKQNLPGVYYVGCSFRGEDHDEMHLNQFYHVECELSGGLDDGMVIAEQYVASIAGALMKDHHAIIRSIAGTTSHIEALLDLYQSNNKQFSRITLAETLSMPEIASNPDTWQYAVENDLGKGRSLTRIGERILIEHFKGAVWLQEMDHLSVPFYQAFVPGTEFDQAKALCADLLLGPGEVLGLGQRHVDHTIVKDALKLHHVPEQHYQWYMDIRDESAGGKPLQTTGWGMGMERFMCWILNHDDVRDIAIIPRLKGMRFGP